MPLRVRRMSAGVPPDGPSAAGSDGAAGALVAVVLVHLPFDLSLEFQFRSVAMLPG